MLDTLVVLMQVVVVALLAWGGWLCLFGRDRRRGSDRRSTARGGRRRGEAVAQVVTSRNQPAMAVRRVRAMTG